MPTHALFIINKISVSFFVIIVLDILFFGGSLKKMLPDTLAELTWYYVLFGLPHIIASFVSYFSKDYITYYKKTILKGLLISFCILALFLLFLPNLFIYFFIAYTLYHVAWQQLGICRRYIENKILYRIWSLSGVTTAITLALSIGGETFEKVPYSFFISLQTVGIASLLLFFLTSLYVYRKSEYVTTTSLIITLSALAILSGYYIVGILMIRFAHDVSAFAIYITHDTKQQSLSIKNNLYSFFKIQPKYIIVFLPLLAISVAFALQHYTSSIFVLVILMLSCMHYYMEGIVWKRGTLHRATIG